MGGRRAILTITPSSLDQVLFEAVSAFATVGLSTGITGDLSPVGEAIIVVPAGLFHQEEIDLCARPGLLSGEHHVPGRPRFT
jgi:hypothetical protein